MRKYNLPIWIAVLAALIFCLINSKNVEARAVSQGAGVGGTVDDQPSGTIYALLIGINEYGNRDLTGCINDTKDLSSKISADIDSFAFSRRAAKQYVLIDENATLLKIKSAIDSIANQAKPEDTFVFTFAGYSSFVGDDTACLYLSGFDIEHRTGQNSLKLPLELFAQWISQIPCDNQVIISEAGQGDIFANSLILSLFEQNAFISAGSDRSRTIVTTNSYGVDCRYGTERRANGPLAHYLCEFDDLFGSLVSLRNNPNKFELQLMQTEMKEKNDPLHCPDVVNNQIYSRVYFERTYQQLFSRLNYSNGMRGVRVDEENAAPDGKHRKIALVIGTDRFQARDWAPLRNPINDAKAVSDILSEKYGYDTIRIFNQERDTVLKKIAQLRLTLDSTDEVLVFIAGHGYYNSLTGGGHIIPTNGESPNLDQLSNSSYLHWDDLKRMFDAWPARNVFVVLDVCFGGKFDNAMPFAKLTDYAAMNNDLTPDQFHERKSKYYSRVFLASGSTSVPDYWGSNGQHSPFASKLIEILKNGKGFITPGQIYSQMQLNITEPELHTFGKHDAVNGEFVLVPKK